jgi:hypothetical protein
MPPNNRRILALNGLRNQVRQGPQGVFRLGESWKGRRVNRRGRPSRFGLAVRCPRRGSSQIGLCASSLLQPTLECAADEIAGVQLRSVVQDVLVSVAGPHEFFALLSHGEIQSQEATNVANIIAAGDEPQVAGAALTAFTQRIAAALDFRQGFEPGIKVGVATAASAGYTCAPQKFGLWQAPAIENGTLTQALERYRRPTVPRPI